MTVLDENVRSDQRQLLERWGIRAEQIGYSVGRWGMQDDEIIPLLHTLRRATFFTRDADFYDRGLRHPRYCLVHLSVARDEVAVFTRRLLRHPEFRTQAQRLGTVMRVSSAGVSVWRPRARKEVVLRWPT